MPFSWLAVLRAPRVSTLPRFASVLNYSNIALYPSIQGFASSLAQTQPSFTLSSENVHILSRPTDFYTRLIVRHHQDFLLSFLLTSLSPGLNTRCRQTNIHIFSLHWIDRDGIGERVLDYDILTSGLTQSDRNHTRRVALQKIPSRTPTIGLQ
jgi:hypothetical protein